MIAATTRQTGMRPATHRRGEYGQVDVEMEVEEEVEEKARTERRVEHRVAEIALHVVRALVEVAHSRDVVLAHFAEHSARWRDHHCAHTTRRALHLILN